MKNVSLSVNVNGKVYLKNCTSGKSSWVQYIM